MNPEKEVILTLESLEALSTASADLKGPEFKLAGEGCCDQCCDDYICSSD